MAAVLSDKPGTNFWIIGAAALAWNLIGLVFYFGHVTISPEALAKLPEAQQDFLVATPAWAISGFAVGVNAGVLASLLLLLRKVWAVPAFALSLAGVLVQDFDAFLLRGGYSVVGVNGIIIPSMVLVIAVLLLWYATIAKGRAWLA
jgi:hypothetical protein